MNRAASKEALSYNGVFGEERVREFRRAPGRRVRDCETDKFITLSELFSLVGHGTPIVVYDVDRVTDVTGDTLLRALLDQRAEGRLKCLNSFQYIERMHTLVADIFTSALSEVPGIPPND